MLPKIFGVLEGLDITDEWGQVVPMLQFVPHQLPITLQIAPIDYGNYVTTCPYKYYMYIYRYIYNKNAHKYFVLVLFYD